MVSLKINERTIFLAITWIAILFFALVFSSNIVSKFIINPNGQTITSLTWAGYIISQSVNPDLAVTAIEASWIVPTLNASARNGYSSAWVGIGGQVENALIQIGTEHDLIDGQASYYAWYETLPDYSMKIEDLKIMPGDTVFASLTLIDPSTNQWMMQIKDETNGQSFTIKVNYSSFCSSGEWIMERPTVNGQIETLSDFGSVHFTESLAIANNFKGSISNFTYSRVMMVNELIQPLTDVSALHPEGSSFTVGFL